MSSESESEDLPNPGADAFEDEDSSASSDSSDSASETDSEDDDNPEQTYSQTARGNGEPTIFHVPRSFFTEDDRKILRTYSVAFRDGNRQEKAQLVAKIVTELIAAGNAHGRAVLRRKVWKYLGSNTRTLERLLPWKKPTLKSVVIHEHDAEIRKILLEEHGVVAGDPGFIGKHATVVKQFMERLSKDTVEELRAKQAEWRVTGPPKTKRRKLAETSLDSLILRFSQKLYWETGARIVVLAGFRGTDSRLRYGAYDYNALVGTGKSGFNKYFPGYSKSEMLQKFQDYLEEHLTDEEDAGPSQRSVQTKPTRKTRPHPSLQTNEWNEPLLPENFSQIVDLDEHRTIIRAWITSFYNLAAGTSKLPVPWASLMTKPDEYITKGSWPADIELREPSKLRKEEVLRLYEYWSKREQNSKVPAFKFHHTRGFSKACPYTAAVDWRKSAKGNGSRGPAKQSPKKPANTDSGPKVKKPKVNDRESQIEDPKTDQEMPDTDTEESAGQSKMASKDKESPKQDLAAVAPGRKETKGKKLTKSKRKSKRRNGDEARKDDGVGSRTQSANASLPDLGRENTSTGQKHLAHLETTAPPPLTIQSPQPFSQNPPDALSALMGALGGASGMPSMDRTSVGNALGLLSQVFSAQRFSEAPIPTSFQIPFSAPYPGMAAGVPAIDPQLNGGYPAYQGYPTQGPNDVTPPGYYAIPHELATGPTSETTNPPDGNGDVAAGKQTGKVKTRKKKAAPAMPTELSKPSLRQSPQKRKFVDFESHGEWTKLRQDGDPGPKAAKRAKVTPRPISTGGRRSVDDPDSDRVFIKGDWGKHR